MPEFQQIKYYVYSNLHDIKKKNLKTMDTVVVSPES